MTTTIFFDMEFTDVQDMAKAGLISIGLISEREGREFYAELTDTWGEAMCSRFVIDTVLPLLEGGTHQMRVETLAVQLKVWIESFSDEVVLKSDAPNADWPFLVKIFDHHGWPENLRRKCGFVYFEHPRSQSRYEAGLAAYWKDHGSRQHHALEDARSMRFAWKLAIRRGL